MYKVMIVDDDSMVFNVVKKTIPWEQYRMEVDVYAPNGLKAIEYLTEHTADILFVDLSMPHMGGIELIRRVYEYLPHTVFVILSSHSEYRLVKESFCIGAFDYLLKVDIDDDEVVNALLSRVTDRLVLLQKESERPFDLGDLVSKLNPHNGVKDDYWYQAQVLSMMPGINRLRLAERVHVLTEGKGIVYGSYEGLFVLLYYDRDKSRAERQQRSVNESLFERDVLVHAAGTSSFGMYRDIGSLYLEAVRNIDDGFLRIKEYLLQNYARQELSLQMVADELNMNKRMVSRYIADYTGLIFKAFLNDIRMDAAREKLRKTSMRVQEVAYSCGYTNVEHFTRMFTDKAGCSPSQYGTMKKP